MKKSELTERLNANTTETHERELAFARVDRCICCGEIVPEGRMICPNCEAELWPK